MGMSLLPEPFPFTWKEEGHPVESLLEGLSAFLSQSINLGTGFKKAEPAQET